jgi:hypothetical protein
MCAIVLAGACDRAPTPAEPRAAAVAPPAAAAAKADFADRIWLRSDPGSAPGAIQIFLGDGSLLTDSCFETYRLSQWRRDGERELVWSEDGIEIRASIVSVDAAELVLRVEAGGGEDQHFRAATVPYVCPDMPR